jgi:16S rRNA (cytosine1402-N4)-methyltransferase
MNPAVAPHIPVLLDEVIVALAPAPGELHVDGTFGAGGYSKALLAAGAEVVAFDRDPDAAAAAKAMVAPSFHFHARRFSELDVAGAVDGVTLDIGVSSMQLDEADRGFSFQTDGPLDMRMERAGESAADFLNTADEAVIADVIYRLGDEPKSRRIARAIVAARPITRTAELASIVRKSVGYNPGMKKDPATRTFQAIRIHINHELEELQGGLEAAERALKPGGRLAVVTFHSLEDRLVKQFLRQRSGSNPGSSRHLPEASRVGPLPTFAHVSRAIRAGEAELARNPRARSATLRSATRTSAPAWSAERNGQP